MPSSIVVRQSHASTASGARRAVTASVNIRTGLGQPRRGARGPPNKGLQLSRALGAGAYSLVGWACGDALVKGGPRSRSPVLGAQWRWVCAGDGAERKTPRRAAPPARPSLTSSESPVEAELERRKWLPPRSQGRTLSWPTCLKAEPGPGRPSILVPWPSGAGAQDGRLPSGNGNKNRSAPVGARATRADAFRPHGNGNEGSPDAKPEQAPNNRLQPTRALGAGAYSLVG